MYRESSLVSFLYHTAPGRCLLKLLVCPLWSKAAGVYLDSSWSRWIIPGFIRKYKINMDEYEITEYASFNDFFTRKKRPSNLNIDGGPDHLISPCDGYLSAYPISEGSKYRIKNVEYHLDRLLKSRKLAEAFEGGFCLVFRLTPQNYHRYCYIDHGVRGENRVIKGRLHSVRPAARERYPVYLQNSREYMVIQTENFGRVVQMEVGALLVGRIRNYCGDRRVSRGREKGYFEFGGSTIVLLVEKESVLLDERIPVGCIDDVGETKVRMGERIGVKKT